MDAARCAFQAGAEDVSIVYRRSFAEMPAWPNERDQAIQTGIHLLTLTAPMDYVVDEHGQLTGLKVIRTKLGPKDARGRRAPQPIPGSEHTLPADLVIEALGQTIDNDLRQALASLRLTDGGLLWASTDTLETSRPGVYAAGDIINGGATVVQAVAEGTRAARAMDEWLRKSDPISG
jgi:glutamate synthase (NADPH/NADH) small chain